MADLVEVLIILVFGGLVLLGLTNVRISFTNQRLKAHTTYDPLYWKLQHLITKAELDTKLYCIDYLSRMRQEYFEKVFNALDKLEKKAKERQTAFYSVLTNAKNREKKWQAVIQEFQKRFESDPPEAEKNDNDESSD